MALEGTFKDFHIADIVQLIGLQRKNGTLTLEGEEDTLVVTFQDGAVVWAESTQLSWDDRLAHLLVARNFLAPNQLQEATTAQEGNRKGLGVLLAERGLVQRKDWEAMLAREVEETVYRPFGWTSGRYRFVSQPSVELPDGHIGPIPAEALLIEGIRRVDEWPLIHERVPSKAMVFKVGGGRFNPKQVEDSEVKMLDLVDGKRSAQDLVDASGLGEFGAMRALASLVSAGAISAVGPVSGDKPSEAPAIRVAPTRAPRRPVEFGRWIPPVVWGAAAVCLVVSIAVFRAEPLGLFPVSPGRVAALDQVRTVRARADLIRLAAEVGRYAAVVGTIPAGLEALGVRDPGVAARLLDPWSRPYQIRSATGDAAGEASLRSAGADGGFGTPDDIVVGAS
jgi:hypothetical protein